MKFLIVLLILGVNNSFAQEKDTLEERVTALKKRLVNRLF